MTSESANLPAAVDRAAFQAGGVWTLTRESPDFTPLDFRQRFTGTFSPDQNTISGAWETSPADGGQWKHDFGLTYRRAG